MKWMTESLRAELLEIRARLNAEIEDESGTLERMQTQAVSIEKFIYAARVRVEHLDGLLGPDAEELPL